MSSSSRSMFQALGEGGWKFFSDIIDMMALIGEIGVALVQSVRKPMRVKWRETFYYMDQCGSEALPIVSLLGFLVGVILAFQAVVQLQKFGVDSFVTDLVGVTIVRELGPLMVAIVIAGRSGSAFASEIGTMKVSEQIDAMITMGFDPSRFIIIPKILAMIAVMPLLTIFADIAGVAGGMAVAYFKLGISLRESYYNTIDVISPAGIFQGLLKSVVFALIIAGVGCMRGIQSGDDAQGVGKASTSAVVTGIFLIVIADAIVTAMFSF